MKISAFIGTRASIWMGLGLAVAALLGLRPWQLATSTIEDRVIAGLESATHSKVSGVGSATFALLPSPHVSLRDLKLTQNGGVLAVSVTRARASIRIGSLFGGKLDYDDLQLSAPQIDIAVGRNAETPGDLLAPAVALLGEAAGHGRIVILDGHARAVSPAGETMAVAQKVNLVIARRLAAAPIILKGSLIWRDEALAVEALWPVLPEKAPAALKMRSDNLSWSFEGTREASAGRVLEGRMRIESAALSSTLDWLGVNSPLIKLRGALKLSAQASIAAGQADLTQVSATLGKDQFEGALAVDTTGPSWSLSGTLAGGAFDLGPILQQVGMPVLDPEDDGQSSARELAGLTRNGLDLRLSFDTLKIGEARLSDVAAQMLVKPGRFDISLLQAGAYGGTGKGKLLVAQGANGLDVRLQANFEKVDLARVSALLPEPRRLSGIGNGQLQLDGSGSNPAAVLASAAGRIGLAARNGEIAGVALADLLRRFERQPLAAFGDWRGGRTSFDSAALSATIAGGVAQIGESVISGAGYKLALSGRSTLLTRQLALSGVLSAAAKDGARIAFEITGPILDPLITPDTQIFIQRTGVTGTLQTK